SAGRPSRLETTTTGLPSRVKRASVFRNASTSGLALLESSAMRAAAAPEGASGRTSPADFAAAGAGVARGTSAVGEDAVDAGAAACCAARGGALRSGPSGAVAQAKTKA